VIFVIIAIDVALFLHGEKHYAHGWSQTLVSH